MRLRSLYDNLLIKNKVLVLVLLITLLSASSGFVAFHTAATAYETKLYEEAAEVLNLASTTVDNELKKIEDLSFSIMTDNTIQEHLRKVKAQEPGYELYQRRADLLDRLVVLAQEQPYIASIRLIDATGVELIAGYIPRQKEEASELTAHAGLAAGGNRWLPGAPGDDLLTSVRLIRNKENLQLDHLGLLVIYVNMRTLVDRFLDLSDNRLYYVFKDGELLHAIEGGAVLDDAEQRFAGMKGYEIFEFDGRKRFTAYYRSRDGEFLHVNMIDFDRIARKTAAIRSGMIVFYAAMSVLFLVIASRAARGITRPLERLIEKMKQVPKGGFELPVSAEDRHLSRDETGEIHRHFRIMIEKINELISENYEKQLLIRETEYRALQAQINPHFLYNTLDTVAWMARINKQRDISLLVESLGRLLRAIIGKREALVKLSDELEITSHYVTIQRFRFGDRLEFLLTCDDALQHALIPKLTIQPLVENAVVHALEETDSVCAIEVDISETASGMEIRVTDDGPGIDEEVVAAVKAGTMKPKGSGIGLANIEERLKLLFGDNADLIVQRRPEGGTAVTIRMPVRRKEENDV